MTSRREIGPYRYRQFILINFYRLFRSIQLFVAEELKLHLLGLKSTIRQVLLDIIIVQSISPQVCLDLFYLEALLPQKLGHRHLLLDLARFLLPIV